MSTGSWSELREANPQTAWEPKEDNFCAQTLALLGLLTPQMNQAEIWAKFDDVLVHVKLPAGDEHYGDRMLKLIKSMTKAERLALRDRVANVAVIQARPPEEQSGTAEGMEPGDNS